MADAFELPVFVWGPLAEGRLTGKYLSGQTGRLTAVETALSLPIVVWNNAALGQIRDDMVAAGIPQLGVVGRNPDFVALALACGAKGCRVHDAAALTTAIRAALSHAGPTLIEVVALSFET